MLVGILCPDEHRCKHPVLIHFDKRPYGKLRGAGRSEAAERAEGDVPMLQAEQTDKLREKYIGKTAAFSGNRLQNPDGLAVIRR
ncbi:hypothetical protein D3C75_924620 [compost metagenome]